MKDGAASVILYFSTTPVLVIVTRRFAKKSAHQSTLSSGWLTIIACCIYHIRDIEYGIDVFLQSTG